jgi:RNA polymerase sigma-70 factor (ECF subfamily)
MGDSGRVRRIPRPLLTLGLPASAARGQLRFGTIDSSRDQVTPSEREEMLVDQPQPIVDRDLVAAALGRLTSEHRDVLKECYFRGSSVAQAADALEIATDLVKCRAYYALHALRLAIDELSGVL